MECYINFIYCPPNQSLGDGVVHLVIVGGTPFPPEMITLGVSTHGVSFGGFVFVSVPGVITVGALVAEVYSMRVAPLVPTSPFLRSFG